MQLLVGMISFSQSKHEMRHDITIIQNGLNLENEKAWCIMLPVLQMANQKLEQFKIINWNHNLLLPFLYFNIYSMYLLFLSSISFFLFCVPFSTYSLVPKNPCPSTTAWTVRWPKIVSSPCVHSAKDTHSISSRAKCTRNHHSHCPTFCSNANAGCKASCWSSIPKWSHGNTRFCWASACTPGSPCHCPHRTLSSPHSSQFHVPISWTLYAHSLLASIFICMYSVYSNRFHYIDSVYLDLYCAHSVPFASFR